jgi:hypothetical protein
MEIKNKLDEFIDTLDGPIHQISGDEPQSSNNKKSMSNKTTDQSADMKTSPQTMAFNWGLGYFSGPILESEDIKENILDKKQYNAFDLLNIDEDAPLPEDETENIEYLEKTKYFISVFNDYFDDNEKITAFNYLLKNLDLSTIDNKYKSNIIKTLKNKLS